MLLQLFYRLAHKVDTSKCKKIFNYDEFSRVALTSKKKYECSTLELNRFRYNFTDKIETS